MVPAGGFEPPHPKATDFESVVSTVPPRWLGDEIILVYSLITNYFTNFCRYGTRIAIFF